MWSYYELTTAQNQADRNNVAGYTVPPAAGREFPQGAIRRALVQQSQAQNAEKREAQRSAFRSLIHTLKAVLRKPAVAR